MHGVLKQHHGNSLVDQLVRGFPGGPDGKESVCNAEVLGFTAVGRGSILVWGTKTPQPA